MTAKKFVLRAALFVKKGEGSNVTISSPEQILNKR